MNAALKNILKDRGEKWLVVQQFNLRANDAWKGKFGRKASTENDKKKQARYSEVSIVDVACVRISFFIRF